MHELAHEFTKKKISPWGGIKFFQQTYLRSGLRGDLEEVKLPEGGSNRSYHAIDLIEGFMVSAVLGSRRMAHTGMLRTDEVIRELFGWTKGMASQSTFSRFFRRFSIAYNDELFSDLMQRWWSRMDLEKVTVDLDSSVVNRYGEQEGSAIGYNPRKKGRPSHHPIMAFCDELKMVVNGWMRPGNTNDSSDACCFIDQTLEILPPERIGLFRADAGFYNQDIMYKLEEARVNYIIRARMSPALLEKIMVQQQWHHNTEVFKDAEYAEFRYQPKGWEVSRRAVVVRRPQADKKANTPVLFPNEENHRCYSYTVYITSSEMSMSKVHALYNQRGDCENRIKELKYDFGMDGFCLKDMGATEAAFRWVLMAYNIMALFKQKVMSSPVRHRLSTIRFQCIAIGSYLIKDGRKTKMKLAAEGKRRHFLEHFFERVETLTPPFQFPNA